MVESSSATSALGSNFEGRKFAPKKIRPVDERISFRSLAKFAVPRKTIEFLCERTGCDPSTAKRWLRGESRPSDSAVNAVWANIFARYR